jgi:uncharacterized protein (DUF4213/DUF364 family)
VQFFEESTEKAKMVTRCFRKNLAMPVLARVDVVLVAGSTINPCLDSKYLPIHSKAVSRPIATENTAFQ